MLMRAIQIHEYGGPEVLRRVDIDVPRPGPGEVLVRVVAAGINFHGRAHAAGQVSRFTHLSRAHSVHARQKARVKWSKSARA